MDESIDACDHTKKSRMPTDAPIASRFINASISSGFINASISSTFMPFRHSLFLLLLPHLAQITSSFPIPLSLHAWSLLPPPFLPPLIRGVDGGEDKAGGGPIGDCGGGGEGDGRREEDGEDGHGQFWQGGRESGEKEGGSVGAGSLKRSAAKPRVIK